MPKLLGLLWDRGAPTQLGTDAVFDDEITIGATKLGELRFELHVYVFEAPTRDRACKVFSAHFGDASITDKKYFPYLAGRVGVLSWKRGSWEDRIVASRAEERTIAHVLTAGLARKGLGSPDGRMI